VLSTAASPAISGASRWLDAPAPDTPNRPVARAVAPTAANAAATRVARRLVSGVDMLDPFIGCAG
jgi:hypothetical protein